MAKMLVDFLKNIKQSKLCNNFRTKIINGQSKTKFCYYKNLIYVKLETTRKCGKDSQKCFGGNWIPE